MSREGIQLVPKRSALVLRLSGRQIIECNFSWTSHRLSKPPGCRSRPGCGNGGIGEPLAPGHGGRTRRITSMLQRPPDGLLRCACCRARLGCDAVMSWEIRIVGDAAVVTM